MSPAPYRIVVPKPPFRSRMSLDVPNLLLSLLLCLVVLGIVVGAVIVRQAPLFLPASVVVVLLSCWAMAPRAVAVVGEDLLVERRGWQPVRVPLASIERALPLDRSGTLLRLWGVGGFFGSYGLYDSRALGRFRLYATRGGRAVLVRRTGGALPLVLTPDDVDGAIAAIDPHHGRAPGDAPAALEGTV